MVVRSSVAEGHEHTAGNSAMVLTVSLLYHNGGNVLIVTQRTEIIQISTNTLYTIPQNSSPLINLRPVSQHAHVGAYQKSREVRWLWFAPQHVETGAKQQRRVMSITLAILVRSRKSVYIYLV